TRHPRRPSRPLTREELGGRIKAARLAARLSQQDLALKIGMRYAQDISRYERGKGEIPLHPIDRIAEGTGRPISYFVRDQEEQAFIEARLSDLDAQLSEILRRLGALQTAVDSLAAQRAAPPPTAQGPAG